MKIVATRNELKVELSKLSAKDSIGFVPTMGALHLGHLSLIEQCRIQNNFTVVSIFVNPLQFNNASDFENYPITINHDIELLEDQGVDLLFTPTNDEMYQDYTKINFDLGNLDKVLEAPSRPGHFNGVCNVLSIFFNLIQPQKAYFGRKDFQQVAVVKRLIQLLNLNIQIIECETIRDENGLAMSSRNTRLTPEDKKNAAMVSTFLLTISSNFPIGHRVDMIRDEMQILLSRLNFKLDYFQIVHPNTLEFYTRLPEHLPAVALAAYYAGEVRLIDNVTISRIN